MTVPARKIILVVIVPLLLIMAVIPIASLALAERDAYIYPGNLYAGPVYLGNMDRSQALSKLNSCDSDQLTLMLKVGADTYQVSAQDLGFELDPEGTIEAIEESLGKWDWWQHVTNRSRARSFQLMFKYDRAHLAETVRVLSWRLSRPAQDASIVLQGEELIVVPERSGLRIDPDQAMQTIINTLSGDFKNPVVLPGQIIPARLTAAHIQGIETLLAEEVLSIPAFSKPVRVAADYGKGLIIMPGETRTIAGSELECLGNLPLQEQQQLSKAWCFKAGLNYDSLKGTLSNIGDQPVCLMVTYNQDVFLLHIYGHVSDNDHHMARTHEYVPLASYMQRSNRIRLTLTGQHPDQPDQTSIISRDNGKNKDENIIPDPWLVQEDKPRDGFANK